MGHSNWSEDFYRDREAERARTGKSAFVYHDAIKSGKTARGVHAKMNPKGVTRESRDSDEHPESVAIAVILDQTGSMHGTPIIMQQALPKLMDAIKAGGIADPQILFGAVGDETNNEAASLQIGQFESGIEMDDDLGNIYMEGMGGGSFEESYQNVLYFFARHTSIDCHEKRKAKGYLFIVGDEMAYPNVARAEIEKLFGDKVQDNIPTEDIVKEAQEKYHVYFVIPQGTSHATDPRLHAYWAKLVGPEHVLMVDDPTQICGAVTTAVCNPAQASRLAASSSTNVRL